MSTTEQFRVNSAYARCQGCDIRTSLCPLNALKDASPINRGRLEREPLVHVSFVRNDIVCFGMPKSASRGRATISKV